MLTNIGNALEQYAGDFSGSFPPVDRDDLSPQFLGQKKIDNTAHALCVFISGEVISDDGRRGGSYMDFSPGNLLNKGNQTAVITINGVDLVYTDDYVIDAFGTPVVYDERKSEDDTNGLNRKSFVLISGGIRDRTSSIR